MDEPVRSAPLVQGSLWSAIWVMSWPLLLMTLATSLVGIVDVQVSGYLGSAAQAAVGISEHVIFLFMIFIFSISVGTTAIVSRAYGAGDLGEANLACAQSLLLSLLAGLVLAAFALTFAWQILPLMNQSPDVLAAGVEYLSIFGWHLIPFSFMCIANASFRAIGDARTPLFVVLVEVVICIAGDYLTVLGNWPIPGLGVKGIAYSAVVGAATAAFLVLLMLWRSKLGQSLALILPLNFAMFVRLLRIGLPSALQRLSWAVSAVVLLLVLKQLAEVTPAQASWTIGMRVEGLLFMPLMALGLAVSSIVGQNLGAKELDRAYRAGWNVASIGVVMMLILAVVLFIFADPLARMMSQDEQTIAFTRSYLQINAISEPFLALNMILAGALQGAGDTRYPMFISIFSNWVIRLPLAWLLAVGLQWGPTGVWYSMTISVAVSALLIVLRYRGRQWLQQKV